jgi:transposase
MEPVLNEQSRRRWAATEAKALGRGGVSCVVRVTGLARRTVYRGLDDIRRGHRTELGRIRKRGGGRKPKTSHDPTLMRDLKALVEPATRGDPMKSLLWTSRSLRKLSKELANKGHEISHTVVGELLQQAGYSLQANRKTREGNQHMDRDAQFQYINGRAASFLKDGQPVVSVDTKKKELVGNFKKGASFYAWRLSP